MLGQGAGLAHRIWSRNAPRTITVHTVIHVTHHHNVRPVINVTHQLLSMRTIMGVTYRHAPPQYTHYQWPSSIPFACIIICPDVTTCSFVIQQRCTRRKICENVYTTQDACNERRKFLCDREVMNILVGSYDHPHLFMSTLSLWCYAHSSCIALYVFLLI